MLGSTISANPLRDVNTSLVRNTNSHRPRTVPTVSAATGSLVPSGRGRAHKMRVPDEEVKPSKRFVPAIFSDISDWAKAYKHSVPACDSATIAYCEKFGIHYRITEKAFNHHSLSHICRDEALLKIFVAEGRGKQSLSVLDWFGSGRNLKMTPQCGPFGKTPDGLLMLPSSVALQISYTFAPDTAISGDTARNLASAKVGIDKEVFDVVIVQDVYHDGPTPTSPFTPATCMRLCSRSRTNHIYVANRAFPGMMGADVIDGEKFEQVFYRDEEGMVVSSPEPAGTTYASHPDTNWLFDRRTMNGVDITQLQRIGPFGLVRVACTQVRAQKLGMQIALRPTFDSMKILVKSGASIKLSDDYEFRIPFSGDKWRTYIVHTPTVAKFSLKFGLKQANGQIIDSALATVQRNMELDPEFRAIMSRFPERAREAVSGTLVVVLHNDRERSAKALYELRLAGISLEEKLGVIRSGNTPNIVTERPWFLLLLFVALASIVWPIEGFTVISNWFHAGWTSFADRFFGIWSALVVFVAWSWSVMTGESYGDWTVRAGSVLGFRYRVMSVFLEEIIACHNIPLAAIIAFVEIASLSNTDPRGAVGLSLLHGIRLLMYRSGWGFLAPLLIHLFWNYNAEETPETDVYQNFVAAYAEGQLVEPLNRTASIPVGAVLPSYVSRAVVGPENFRGEIAVSVDGVEVSVTDALELLTEEHGRNVTYPVLVTNRLLHQPANNEKNLLVAILYRLHNDPFTLCPPYKEREAVWKELVECFRRANLFSPSDRMFTHEECFKIMGPKAARLKNALQELTLGKIVMKGKNVNVKWNETLTALKDVSGVTTMKPRAIQNLPAEVHAIMTPYSRVIDHIMHQKFDGSVFIVDGIAFAVVMASGYSGDKLSALGSHFDSSVFTIFVSGDDSAVCFGECAEKYGMSAFGEADQSAFDHTQDEGPMCVLQFALQRMMGIPEEFTQMAYNCCASGYYARKGRLFVKGVCGTQMPTGITTTTVFNSMSTAAFWVYWRLQMETTGYSPVEAGRRLGFGVKFFAHETPQSMTFLKGSWHLSLDGKWHWLPLPSLVLKLGKLISNPVEVTATRRGGKKVRLSSSDALRTCAYALASSYGQVPLEYPVVGAFLTCLRRNGIPPRKALRRIEEGWKPKTEHFRLNRDGALDFMLGRYGISKEEVEDVEFLLGNINSLPAYIEHPLFDKLAEADY